ncbi:TetR/AcrR family transcriptional regulator [Solibacillus sp. FSL H8-0538]|uniref:TetR/AcrR family transcriptional regulator n=1 Tax=Solibacillus sp. FSL H8-0538 TaxID=2921400 RepID=UPI0030F67EDF
MDRRQEILEAASKSFSLFGYKATTMDQVAKIANVGKGTIYTFFANKEELLQEVVISMIREMKAETDATIDPNLGFMKNAHIALMKMLQFRERHLLFAKLIEEEKELRTPTVKQMLLQIEEEIVSYVAGRIQIGIDKDEINPCNPQHVAYLLLKSYLAFIVDWQITHDEQLGEQAILSIFKETIFRGLAKN